MTDQLELMKSLSGIKITTLFAYKFTINSITCRGNDVKNVREGEKERDFKSEILIEDWGSCGGN